MSSGPEHFAEAERLLKPIDRYYNGGQTRALEHPSATTIAAAQAHATLAAAAATIELALSMQDSNGVSVDWLKAVTT